MNLLNKISLWFIGIILITTPISMYISHKNIKKRLDNAEVQRLKNVNAHVAKQLKQGNEPDTYTQGRAIEISKINGPLPAETCQVVHACGNEASSQNLNLKKNECLIRVNNFIVIKDQVYKISSYDYVTNTDQILKGMMSALTVKMTLIIAFIFITARFLSHRILKPFKQAMLYIRHFSLKKNQNLALLPTTTNEFRELNKFLEKMTNKAIDDYTSMKEFSENASHELQTPLAIIQSKLELLSETTIDESQAGLIVDMQNAIDKLTRINRSLVLLTKLENQEFDNDNNMRFCRVTKDTLAAFTDRIAMKNIAISSKLDKNIIVKIHPTLAEILLSNLFQNAIRHNIEGGQIKILLTTEYFSISNTGLPPEIATEELFKRFKKSNQCINSIGLGLAIVKQICEVSQFNVTYHYEDGWHSVIVCFDKNKVIASEMIPVNYEFPESPGLALS